MSAIAQAALDPLGQEQPDHLALGGLDLLAGDHRDRLAPLGTIRCASSAPAISLWSVIAIAPRPSAMQWSSSASTSVAQSWEWLRVHVQVDVDQHVAARPGCGASRGGGRSIPR